MPNLPDLEAWAIFARVAEFGSFSGAARDLALSKATVSKAVARLEQRLGTPLINRTSRRFALTQTGQMAVERATRMLADAQSIDADLSDLARAPRGRVRVAAPISFGIHHLGPALPDFVARYPEIELDLVLSDATADLVASGFDMALRIGLLADSSLRARRICAVRRPLVAAPAYVARAGMPQHPDELGGHDIVLFSHLSSPGQLALRSEGHEASPYRFKGSVTANNADVVVPLLLAGSCAAFVPEFLVWERLRDGSLVELLPGWSSEPLGLHAVMPPGSIKPARVAAFVDFCVQRFGAADWAHRMPEL
ncbi:LysR family transcriptional regulator [Terrihabitans rhizophilus]|uniref:LysR family transcriptional regulator n=1 Tax=Terrihabitans rhizophilus TaxID=3092662 RepID=A0ABU4RJH8_9HYPH|nr:LysR family transcriptional regulator [Terrihabitans sp. PJ23]MDX6804992.1 LysR family transcriptional regulator [Terrihabitans sp. PJ23]